MNKFLLLPVAVVSMAIAPFPLIDLAAGQEVTLTPLEVTDVAAEDRAEMLKLELVLKDKNDMVCKINDFILARTATSTLCLPWVLFSGVSGHHVAVPLRNLKITPWNRWLNWMA